MKSLISYFLNPIPLFGLIIVAAFIFQRLKKKNLSRNLYAIGIIWFLIISTSFVPDLLMNHLEKKYSVFQPGSRISQDDTIHILVLGSGHINDDRLEPHDQLSETSLYRITEGVRLHKLIPNSILITSGFKGKETRSNAEMNAETAISFGVDPNKIKKQTTPENTNEEAIEYKRRFGTNNKLILVTSASHMHRSMQLFQHQGLNPIPAPTNHEYKRSESKHPFRWIPYAYNIEKMEKAMHEYIGLLWMKLTISPF